MSDSDEFKFRIITTMLEEYPHLIGRVSRWTLTRELSPETIDQVITLLQMRRNITKEPETCEGTELLLEQ